jgi:5,10-methylenetetrahydrofolate reductase
MLAERLSTGDFVVTAELGPPLTPDAELVRRKAQILAAAGVHAANITDNQAATVKVSPLACAVWLIEEGLDPILQVTTRDRNLLALQSDLLGAWALGVRSMLALAGDRLAVGPYDGLTTQVSDLNATELIQMVDGMNRGRLYAGERLQQPTGFMIAAALNPFFDTVERLENKIAAGASFFQTNIVYDVERFAEWFAPIVAAGVPERAPVLLGLAPPHSLRMLEHMHNNVPGIEVDDQTFARLKGLEGDEARTAGVDVTVELVRQARTLDGIAGVHLMAPNWETEAIPRVLAALAA